MSAFIMPMFKSIYCLVPEYIFFTTLTIFLILQANNSCEYTLHPGLDLHRGHWGHGPWPRVSGGPFSIKKYIFVEAKSMKSFF